MRRLAWGLALVGLLAHAGLIAQQLPPGGKLDTFQQWQPTVQTVLGWKDRQVARAKGMLP